MSDAAQAVRWLLEQAEPEARRVAVRQVAKVRGRDGPELLLRALGDEDWRVRKEATQVAALLELRDEVVAALVAALEDTVNIGLRNAAVEALIAIGTDAVGTTVEALPRVDSDARKLAIEVLGGIPDPRGTRALERALADDDANVRVAAAEALGNAGIAGEEPRLRAIEALVSVLSTGDSFLKIAALESLARLEARLPWSVFEPCAAHPLLRRYAIAAAAATREPEAIRELAFALGDRSPTIAREALASLGELLANEARDGERTELLTFARVAVAHAPGAIAAARRAALDGEDTRARGGGLLVLGLSRHSSDVAALVRALGDDDVVEPAHVALRLFGKQAVEPLLDAARTSTSPLRALALSLAASLEGADAALVCDALRDALTDDSPDVLACGLEALGRLGKEEDLRRVARFVRHDDERVAATAHHAVSELASRHVTAARALLSEPRAGQDPLVLGSVLLGAIASVESLLDDDVRLLRRALAHDDPKVRRAAIEALAQAGSQAAADAIAFALADEERDVKLAAVGALGRLGRASALAGILADTRDAGIAVAALRALRDADPARALTVAEPLVLHTDPAIASAAVETVGQLTAGEESRAAAASREDALFAALEHPDREVVKLALSLLAAAPGARALAKLGVCLDHPSWEVRRLAAELLGSAQSGPALGLLRARYDRERDPLVREAIAAAVSMRPAGAHSGSPTPVDAGFVTLALHRNKAGA